MWKDKKIDFKEWDIVVKIKTTNGVIQVLMTQQETPHTCNNFIWLAQQGYYDGIIFHRIIHNFMIQWWDPTGSWMWGTSIYWEKFSDEFHKECRNDKYTLSMANSWPNTNGSQFFINQNDNHYLDNKHSVFGRVIEWKDNVDKIAKVKVDSQDRPKKEVKIINMEVEKYCSGEFKPYTIDIEKTVAEYNGNKNETTTAKKDKKIETGDTILVHYTLKLEDWSIKDSSHNRWEPFKFVTWEGQVIAGWDKWVLGRKIWEKFELNIEPVEWYWEYDSKKIKIMSREELQSFVDAGISLEVWEKLPTQYGYFNIKETSETDITIDINHELAWKKLLFDVEIIDII